LKCSNFVTEILTIMWGLEGVGRQFRAALTQSDEHEPVLMLWEIHGPLDIHVGASPHLPGSRTHHFLILLHLGLSLRLQVHRRTQTKMSSKPARGATLQAH